MSAFVKLFVSFLSVACTNGYIDDAGCFCKEGCFQADDLPFQTRCCTEICEEATDRGTEEQCKRHCPCYEHEGRIEKTDSSWKKLYFEAKEALQLVESTKDQKREMEKEIVQLRGSLDFMIKVVTPLSVTGSVLVTAVCVWLATRSINAGDQTNSVGGDQQRAECKPNLMSQIIKLVSLSRKKQQRTVLARASENSLTQLNATYNHPNTPLDSTRNTDTLETHLANSAQSHNNSVEPLPRSWGEDEHGAQESCQLPDQSLPVGLLNLQRVDGNLPEIPTRFQRVVNHGPNIDRHDRLVINESPNCYLTEQISPDFLFRREELGRTTEDNYQHEKHKAMGLRFSVEEEHGEDGDLGVPDPLVFQIADSNATWPKIV